MYIELEEYNKADDPKEFLLKKVIEVEMDFVSNVIAADECLNIGRWKSKYDLIKHIVECAFDILEGEYDCVQYRGIYIKKTVDDDFDNAVSIDVYYKF